MPWIAFSELSETDQKAIVAYLRSIPPITNKIPDPEQPGFFTYLGKKFNMLIMKEDQPVEFVPGNNGDPDWGTEEGEE